MKLSSKNILLFAAFSVMLSCNKEDIQDTITIPNQEDLTPYFDVHGGSKSVLFSASSEWTAVVLNDVENDWVSVSPSNGQGGDATLFITAKENLTTDDRTAIIEIRCGTAKKQILATQKQKNALLLSKNKYDVKAAGETLQIEVQANVSYSVDIDEKCSGWIKKEQTKAMQTSTFNIVVAPNEDTGKREGKIVVSDGTLSETVIISQEGAAPAIVLSEHEYVIPSSGETIEVEVSHNVNVSCVMPSYANWISLVSTKGMTSNTYTFSIAKNDGYDGREADIKFTNASNGLSETIHIAQLQKDAIVFAKNEYFVPRAGGTVNVSVGHNVEFSTSVSVGWISQADTKSFVSETLCFQISENISGQDRTGEIKFTSADGAIEQAVRVSQSADDYTLLSANGTANCYIVSTPGIYGFNGTVKGNSTESVGSPVSAEVIWESFGTATAPKVGDIINSVSIENGIVIFSTPATLKNGNAVIAVKDISGRILWSWHIWVCDGYDPNATGQVYNNNAGTMMDRNLGALSSSAGDILTHGLLYQWGRKDPFLGTNSYSSTAPSASTINWPKPQNKTTEIGTVEYSVEHPAMFILGRDWMYTRNDELWKSSKTKYDPCPNGWRVPDYDTWSKAIGSSQTRTITWTNNAVNLSSILGDGRNQIIYPQSAVRDDYSGNLTYSSGSYNWSCNTNGGNVYTFHLQGNIMTPSCDYDIRGYGRTVRCLKEN